MSRTVCTVISKVEEIYLSLQLVCKSKRNVLIVHFYKCIQETALSKICEVLKKQDRPQIHHLHSRSTSDYERASTLLAELGLIHQQAFKRIKSRHSTSKAKMFFELYTKVIL